MTDKTYYITFEMRGIYQRRLCFNRIYGLNPSQKPGSNISVISKGWFGLGVGEGDRKETHE